MLLSDQDQAWAQSLQCAIWPCACWLYHRSVAHRRPHQSGGFSGGEARSSCWVDQADQPNRSDSLRPLALGVCSISESSSAGWLGAGVEALAITPVSAVVSIRRPIPFAEPCATLTPERTEQETRS
jgi:hypothetical protein